MWVNTQSFRNSPLLPLLPSMASGFVVRDYLTSRWWRPCDVENRSNPSDLPVISTTQLPVKCLWSICQFQPEVYGLSRLSPFISLCPSMGPRKFFQHQKIPLSLHHPARYIGARYLAYRNRPWKIGALIGPSKYPALLMKETLVLRHNVEHSSKSAEELAPEAISHIHSPPKSNISLYLLLTFPLFRLLRGRLPS